MNDHVSEQPHQMIRIVAGLAKPILGTDVRDGFVDNVGVGPVYPRNVFKIGLHKCLLECVFGVTVYLKVPYQRLFCAFTSELSVLRGRHEGMSQV